MHLSTSSQRVLAGIACCGLMTITTACGSSDATVQAVASIDGTAAVASGAQDQGVDVADAALAYVECMRDNGVELSDPTFDAEGNLEPRSLLGDLGAGFDPGSEDVRDAQSACGDLLDGVTFGGGLGGGEGLDRSAIEEGLLAYTSCLRDEGLEVDDLTFGGGPGAGGGAALDGGEPPAGGAPEGGFQDGAPPDPSGGGAGFDPTEAMIEQLDLDDSDPEVAAALEACEPVLDQAFSGAPVGGEES